MSLFITAGILLLEGMVELHVSFMSFCLQFAFWSPPAQCSSAQCLVLQLSRIDTHSQGCMVDIYKYIQPAP